MGTGNDKYFMGSAYDDAGVTQPLLWSQGDRKVTVLDLPRGVKQAMGGGINRDGVATVNTLPQTKPYLWARGKYTKLASRPEPPPPVREG